MIEVKAVGRLPSKRTRPTKVIHPPLPDCLATQVSLDKGQPEGEAKKKKASRLRDTLKDVQDLTCYSFGANIRAAEVMQTGAGLFQAIQPKKGFTIEQESLKKGNPHLRASRLK